MSFFAVGTHRPFLFVVCRSLFVACFSDANNFILALEVFQFVLVGTVQGSEDEVMPITSVDLVRRQIREHGRVGLQVIRGVEAVRFEIRGAGIAGDVGDPRGKVLVRASPLFDDGGQGPL